MFEANQVANRVLEEVCDARLELLDHGLRIFDEYGLFKADIHCPPPVDRNILYARITQLIEYRHDRLPLRSLQTFIRVSEFLRIPVS